MLVETGVLRREERELHVRRQILHFYDRAPLRKKLREQRPVARDHARHLRRFVRAKLCNVRQTFVVMANDEQERAHAHEGQEHERDPQAPRSHASRAPIGTPAVCDAAAQGRSASSLLDEALDESSGDVSGLASTDDSTPGSGCFVRFSIAAAIYSPFRDLGMMPGVMRGTSRFE